MRSILAVALTAIVALSGCGTSDNPETPDTTGSPDPTEASECLETMRLAADEIDPSKAVPLITETLDACKTADEWLAALEKYPAAMGLGPQDNVGDDSLAIACAPNQEAAVCKDFMAKLQERQTS